MIVSFFISLLYARDNEEFVGEMHMKDYIDVSNQENVAPVYFQSLSLD